MKTHERVVVHILDGHGTAKEMFETAGCAGPERKGWQLADEDDEITCSRCIAMEERRIREAQRGTAT